MWISLTTALHHHSNIIRNPILIPTLYVKENLTNNQATPDFLLDTNKPENRNKCKALPKENWLLCHREGLSKESITEQVF